jgi:hypothetical protein
MFLPVTLVLQRKRADCGIASPVIAGLCGQNANRQSKHEREFIQPLPVMTVTDLANSDRLRDPRLA